ncbi:phospho-N-acetylmuramoyl-pentapeptide-transferase [Alkalibacterium sp. MB6]|uniref:phospho-N-acetylmuramoyl-pentapeptide- transferase n=1 Tax=Alkalibacterium sp. MB6 TaxID=2081965 RepID=UPI00137B4A81|nr:phospho-N-acetylmuramoyl-pentapeptide-transferase [Alkalibacterium sp. MB6]
MEQTNLFYPFLLGGLVTAGLMPAVINYFKRKQLGQITKEKGPTWHGVKSGTPTMGGVSILVGIVFSSILFALLFDYHSGTTLLLSFIFVVYAAIGFVDDYIKVVMKRNLGLTSLQKLMGQIVGAVIFYFGLNQLIDLQTVQLPFGIELDLGIFYILFVLFWMVGFSNATNLTDGIDGLLASTGFLAYGAYTVIAIWQSQYDVALFTLSAMGALLAFFLFNKKPAKIFMGDVGSLALGAGLAGVSIVLNQEWTLLLIGIIFVFETASVMIQVTSMKTRDKRVFKMSPIHHHFELVGWSEWKIVIIFSSITLIASLLVLLTI